jgi:phage gpG-like protein
MIIGTIKNDIQVLKRLNSIPDSLHKSLLDAIKRESYSLEKYIVKSKLSGDPLKRKSGTLSRSIKTVIDDKKTSIVGIVGVRADQAKALRYAAIHEYGFTGPVSVKEHLRNQTMAWGKAITPVQVTVKAHTMNMNMPVRSFIRSSLAENKSEILSEIDKAVAQGMKNNGP